MRISHASLCILYKRLPPSDFPFFYPKSLSRRAQKLVIFACPSPLKLTSRVRYWPMRPFSMTKKDTRASWANSVGVDFERTSAVNIYRLERKDLDLYQDDVQSSTFRPVGCGNSALLGVDRPQQHIKSTGPKMFLKRRPSSSNQTTDGNGLDGTFIHGTGSTRPCSLLVFTACTYELWSTIGLKVGQRGNGQR